MLQIHHLRRRFGPMTAVDDLSFAAAPGECLGLLGPNGAGKSTTVSIVTGLLPADGGTVRIADRGGPGDPAVRAMTGVAPQALAFYDELTLIENIRFFGRLYDLAGPRLRARTAEVLDLVGLSDRAGSRAGTCSGGMKRRLNLAIALVHGPRLLILDEPTAGVDPQSRAAIMDTLEHLRATGVTILYTTHLMEEAERLCDRIVVIDRGRLVAEGTPSDLIRRHGGPATIVLRRADGTAERLPAASPRDTLLALLQDRDVMELHIERPTLETVFLNLTGRALRDEA
ncbi:MAG: ABC transporter ATP-binding protein [Phycisphaeraceae bacterium]|nr:ABC transporter ATP-binding protein [Phycisphaeraceae bacterium]